MKVKNLLFGTSKQIIKPASDPPGAEALPRRTDPEVAKTVLGAAWIASDVLLAVVRWTLGNTGAFQRTGPSSGMPTAADVRMFSYPTDRRLLLIAGVSLSPEEGSVIVGDDNRSIPVQEIARAITDLSTLVRDNLSGLEPAVRLETLAFLTSALSIGSKEDHGLIANVHLIREALREHLPFCETKPGLPLGLHIDELLVVDEQSFYVRGWLWDRERDVIRLVAESPEGCRVELFDGLVPYPRPDIPQFYGVSPDEGGEAGFIRYFQTDVPSYLREGWVFEIHSSTGVARQTQAPTVIHDLLTVRNRILDDLDFRHTVPLDFLGEHLFPAINTLQSRHRQAIEVKHVEQYGKAVTSADVSIIIPLYKRLEFLEHQLAQFALDEEMYSAELIYVLDSPEQSEQLREYASQLFRLYRVPFKIVILNRNAGFSTANNLGIAQAHGRLLLLLNSDVLPDKPGWLGAMAAFYDARPKVGALGPKLLYEDDSLQHAGLYFLRPEGSEEWENMHYFKGLHRLFPPANAARPVPAVTGACLMINRKLYQETGGLQGLYVRGDYEDSDLCLRLVEAGYVNWYYPNAELYHLEGQSYPGNVRRHAHQYNQWLHTRLWGERIEQVMAEHPASRSVMDSGPERAGAKERQVSWL